MEAAKEFVRHSRSGSTVTRARVLKELLSAVEEKREHGLGWRSGTRGRVKINPFPTSFRGPGGGCASVAARVGWDPVVL